VVAVACGLLAGSATVLACRDAESAPTVPDSVLPGVEAPRAWVTILDPDRASPGYTLDLHRRRVPILVDLAGRIVHAWPEARVKSRVRLLPDGSLLAIALGRGLVRYDWEGREVWRYNAGPDLPHHDVIALSNGNVLAIVRRDGEETDDLLELDEHGEELWRWRSADHLVAWADERGISRDDGDLTHLNSVQELPANRWAEAGDQRFRPGNLLISARNLDAVFVIARDSGEVVWSWDQGLDMQHEALMVGPGLPGEGAILLLDNGFRGRHLDRQSRVISIDPLASRLDWEYRSEAFYTPTAGVQQPLPNGNVLVTSTRGGRVFEVTREGAIVWEWLPPTQPVRAARYARDHAPQLAALPRVPLSPVVPPEGYRWIDPRVYQFARRGVSRTVEIEGAPRRVLGRKAACRRLLVPGAPRLALEYGIDRAGLEAAGAAPGDLEFTVTVAEEQAEPVVLLRDRVGGGDPDPWRRWHADLDRLAFRRVTLCVSVEPVDRSTAVLPFGYLGTPSLAPRVLAGGKEPGGDLLAEGDEGEAADLTEEELEEQRRHLRALGYVD
jgi:hypothetical protein